MSQDPHRIHIKRYPNPADVGDWQRVIEPEDRSWIVFQKVDGSVLFMRRVEYRDEDGAVQHGYADVEIPGSMPMRHLQTPLPQPKPLPPGSMPIDFTVRAMREPKMDAICAADHAQQETRYPDRKDGFIAELNCRSIGCWGETEHEAVQSLLNECVRLAVAGCLDHTGEPVRYVSERRRKYVFGPEG